MEEEHAHKSMPILNIYFISNISVGTKWNLGAWSFEPDTLLDFVIIDGWTYFLDPGNIDFSQFQRAEMRWVDEKGIVCILIE